MIVLAQVNTISGNIEYNKNKAIDYIKKAKEIKATTIIFPELYLSSSPIGNILNRYPFIYKQINKALDEIIELSEDINILIGFPKEKEDGFLSSVAFIKNKKIEKIITKENQENRIITLDNLKYGIIFTDEINNEILIENLSQNINSIIHVSSIPSRLNKEENLCNLILKHTSNHLIDFIHVNQVGANDELVFDGNSKVFNKNSKLVAQAKSFEEDFLIVNNNKEIPFETKNPQKNFTLDYEHDLKRTYNSLVLSIKDYFSKNGFKKAVLGLSGGLDSTICAVLLADALGNENVLGVSMPSKLTSPESKNDAKELANNLKINFMEVAIKDIQDFLGEKYENLFSKITFERNSQSFTQDNIQARSRSMILWGIANEFQGTLPIATSDKSETYMGYATINGDMSGGFSPIADVVKTKLFALARWMNENRQIKNAIPISIIQKPPGAELAIDPKTGKTLLAEDALMPYEFMDEVIWRIENFNQSINDMMKFEFLYEKKNILDKSTKELWLKKFFKRLNTALYKWYITPPSPIVDANSINKSEYKQLITSNINYSK